jgi:hypothetical protein
MDESVYASTNSASGFLARTWVTWDPRSAAVGSKETVETSSSPRSAAIFFVTAAPSLPYWSLECITPTVRTRSPACCRAAR